VFSLKGPVDWEPLDATVPLQPPDAVQLTAAEAVQFSIELCPTATLAGVDDRVSAGATTVAGGSVAFALVPQPARGASAASAPR